MKHELDDEGEGEGDGVDGTDVRGDGDDGEDVRDDDKNNNNNKHKNVKKRIKKVKFIDDPDKLARVHGLTFDKKDRIINEQILGMRTVDRIQQDIKEAARAKKTEEKQRREKTDRLNEQVRLMIADSNKNHEDNNNNNINTNTRIVTSKLKRICTADLQKSRIGTINENESEIVEKERRKDIIYNLMTNNSREGLELLKTYATVAFNTLKLENCYPVGAKQVCDARIWDEGMASLMNSEEPGTKRAFIWTVLYVSLTFADVFCPKSGTGEFLTDPEKLGFFLRDVDSPLTRAFTDMILPCSETEFGVPASDVETFASIATFEWIKLRPWTTVDTWKNMRPDAPSLELRLMLDPASVSVADKKRASHFIQNARSPESEDNVMMISDAPDADQDDN